MSTASIPSFANADFNQRMSVLKQLANMTGVRLPSTIIPEGESLIPYGEERQRALRDDVYSLPTLDAAYDALYQVRMEQQPVDVKVPLQRVRMDCNNGGLYSAGSESKAPPLGYTGTAFSQVAAVVKPASITSGFHQTLLALPPAIRADAFNSFAERSTEARDVILRTTKAPVRHGADVILRRSINAVVSERYSAVDDHDLIRDLGSSLPAGARVRYTQSESRSDLEIIWPAMSRQLKVGDIALVCLHVGNSQTKQLSIKLAPKVLRLLCSNFTTAYSEGGEQEINVRHVGEARVKFAAAIRNALAIVEPFVLAFADAYQTPFPAFAPTRGEAINKFIVSNDLAPKLGEATAELWDADGTMGAGDTLAGLANAITRASQVYSFANAEPIEAAAGRLVREGWDSIA